MLLPAYIQEINIEIISQPWEILNSTKGVLHVSIWLMNFIKIKIMISLC